MVALNPQFALLAAQCMISFVALPSPATAIAVRSSHSNHSGHFRQRPVIPAPSGNSTKEHGSQSAVKKHRAREYSYGDDSNHGVDASATPSGLRVKTRDQRVLEARDSLTQEDLAGLLGPLLGPLLDAVNALLNGLKGLVPRHESDNVIEYNNGPSHNDILERGLPRRRHHDHHDHNYDVHDETIYNNGPSHNHIHERSFLEYMDAIPGTAALMDGDDKIIALLELMGSGFRASQNATTIFLKPAAAVPGSDGKQFVQLVVPGCDSQGTTCCATYDPNPDEPSEMTAEPCSSQATVHQSQFFSYDAASGCLEPMQQSGLETGGDSLPATDGLDADSDNLPEEENVRVLARATGTSLKFIPQMGMKEDNSSTTSVTTVTVTETATQADSSSAAAAVATPPMPVDATNALGSMPTPVPPVPSPMSPSLPGIVEVALPSSTSTSASPESSDVSSTVSTDPASVAASIASSSTADATTTSGTSSYPTPASLLVEITPPASAGSSA